MVHRWVQEDIAFNVEGVLIEKVLSTGQRVDVIEDPDSKVTVLSDKMILEFWEIKPASYQKSAGEKSERYTTMLEQMSEYCDAQYITLNGRYDLEPAENRVIPSNTFTRTDTNGREYIVYYYDAGYGRIFYTFSLVEKNKQTEKVAQAENGLLATKRQLISRIFGSYGKNDYPHYVPLPPLMETEPSLKDLPGYMTVPDLLQFFMRFGVCLEFLENTVPLLPAIVS